MSLPSSFRLLDYGPCHSLAHPCESPVHADSLAETPRCCRALFEQADNDALKQSSHPPKGKAWQGGPLGRSAQRPSHVEGVCGFDYISDAPDLVGPSRIKQGGKG